MPNWCCTPLMANDTLSILYQFIVMLGKHWHDLTQLLFGSLTRCVSSFSYYYRSTFFCNWSLWQPLECNGKKFWKFARIQDSAKVNIKNFHARTVNSLAPPTRQSLKCIQLYNFGLVGPISQMRYRWSPWITTSLWRQIPPVRFSTILNFCKNIQNADYPISTGHGTWNLQIKPHRSYHVDFFDFASVCM